MRLRLCVILLLIGQGRWELSKEGIQDMYTRDDNIDLWVLFGCLVPVTPWVRVG
jgi:hypothetical protein